MHASGHLYNALSKIVARGTSHVSIISWTLLKVGHCAKLADKHSVMTECAKRDTS